MSFHNRMVTKTVKSERNRKQGSRSVLAKKKKKKTTKTGKTQVLVLYLESGLCLNSTGKYGKSRVTRRTTGSKNRI